MEPKNEIGIKTCNYAGMEMLLVDVLENKNLPYASNFECYTYEGGMALHWYKNGEYAQFLAEKNKPVGKCTECIGDVYYDKQTNTSTCRKCGFAIDHQKTAENVLRMGYCDEALAIASPSLK